MAHGLNHLIPAQDRERSRSPSLSRLLEAQSENMSGDGVDDPTNTNIPSRMVVCREDELIRLQNHSNNQQVWFNNIVRKGNRISGEGAMCGMVSERILVEILNDWLRWDGHHSTMAKVLVERVQRFITSHQIQGIEADYEFHAAFMSLVRWKIEDRHADELQYAWGAPQHVRTNMQTDHDIKMRNMRDHFENKPGYFSLHHFHLPLFRAEIDDILSERALRLSYQSLGWRILRDAGMSRREILVWIIKLPFKKRGCIRRRL